jgi:peptide/nickel transport system permease protein
MRRVLDRLPRQPVAIVLALLLAGLLIVCVFGEHWWGNGARTLDVANGNLPPSSAHRLGTDALGHDVLDRTLVATRLSLELALVATAIATTFGYTLGALLTMLGPRARRIGLGALETALAFPAILVAIFVTAVLDPGKWTAAVAIGIAFVPNLARVAYTVAAAAVGSEYIAAARALGVRPVRLFIRHLLPNIAEPLLITASFAVGTCLISVSALSFLGLGVQAPDFDWGSMLSDGIRAFYTAPAQALAPAVAITIAGLTVGLAGETFARLANPQLRGRRRAAGGHAAGLAEIAAQGEAIGQITTGAEPVAGPGAEAAA